ncbi:MAG: TIGR03619 family F420-dependent LLM class oxidoreductase [Acidimicrobiales bacterium]|nr:TIGR03619 family F420-dependent LLM class oxidoreductase [Acidimicrobiales bacterium]
MRIGIHLPQFGKALGAGGIQKAAIRAEELGFDDVWVSDHLVVPVGQSYPTPYLYDPLMTLAFAGAVTERIGLGTSVLVATQYTSPLALANSLASLDHMSGGRLTVGAGIGWSRAEYEALGATFGERGQRLEEIVEVWRTAWRDDPATHEGRFYPFRDVRVLPKPAHAIPIWLGGSSDAAISRATRLADGYHGVGVEPEDAPRLIERIRAGRPEESFTVSLRVRWDARVDDEAVAETLEAYSKAGIQHLHYAPERGDLDTWITNMERLATQTGLRK